MIHQRHIQQPLRSAKSIMSKIYLPIYRYIAKRQFDNIRRESRIKCWCGGGLLPFKWHNFYGICDNCGCYVNRKPPCNDELERIYSFNFYWHKRQIFLNSPPIEQRIEHDRLDGRVNFWLVLIERFAPQTKSAVEVGCGSGVLLFELKKKGYECIGLEPDKRTAAWVGKNLGLDIRPGFFPDTLLPHCDLFLAFDVLEHSPNPFLFFREAAKILKPGGILIIQTPIDRYDMEPVFGDKFDSAFNDLEHLYVFSDKAMEELAKRTGLEILNMSERWRLHHEICIFSKPGIRQ